MKRITFEQATELARCALNAIEIEQCLNPSEEGSHVFILWHVVTELPYGWVFPYNSRRCVEFGEALLGNSPILVSRWGRVEPIGTAFSFANRIKNYESKHFFEIFKHSVFSAFRKPNHTPMQNTELYRQKISAFKNYIERSATSEIKERWLSKIKEIDAEMNRD